MKKINKKGFTLIELMAVVIVLIVIIFIAINKVNKTTKNTKNETLKANALSYINAVNSLIDEDSLVSSRLKNGRFDRTTLEEYGVNISGTKPDTAEVLILGYDIFTACMQYGSKYVLYEDGKVKEPEKGNCSETGSSEFTYGYVSRAQEFTAPYTAVYKIELWGAQGGEGANGGYTSGEISLEKGSKLYFYVGQEGPHSAGVTNIGGWNGGGYSGNDGGSYSYGGGGATDVRITSGSWNDATSLRSRIMVAGGGGGSFSTTSHTKIPGVGGNLIGGDAGGSYGSTNPGGGKQTTYGSSQDNSRHGSFGYAMQSYTSGWGGGGGGGYWGGSNGYGKAAAGGSSYISGYAGCVAVISDASNSPRLDSNNATCTEGTTDQICSIHYSGKVFNNGLMRSGAEEMPTHDGNDVMIGNTGNGYAKISIVGKAA